MHLGKHLHEPFQRLAQMFVVLLLRIVKPREFYSIRNFHSSGSSIHESTIMLRVCLTFCVFLLSLSLPVHQNAHVNKLSVCDKVYSGRCLFYFQSSTVNIFKFKGKYSLRQTPHASHGSFNPYVISNKLTSTHYQWEYTSSYQRNR